MILNYNKFGKQNKRSKSVVCAWAGRVSKHNFLSGGAFHKAKYEKLRRRKSKVGTGIYFPHPPFLPAPPEWKSFNQNPNSENWRRERDCLPLRDVQTLEQKIKEKIKGSDLFRK